MFPFDDPNICLSLLVIFIICFIAIIILLVKKYELLVINGDSLDNIKKIAKKIFSEQGYKVEERKKYMYVQSGTFTATKLFFKQDGSDVIVYRASSSTPIADIVMLAGVLVSGIIVPLILSIIIEVKSRSFAKEEVYTYLKDYKKWIKYCPWCNRDIPNNSKLCPYCGKKVEGY